MRKQNKGITLIALVITIIVLLILAGVAISMLSGENGILNQAATAKTETEKKSTEEAVKLAVMSALTAGEGKIDKNVLNSELSKVAGETINIDSLPIEDLEIKGAKYTINENGTVTIKNENNQNGEITKTWTQDRTTVTDGTTTFNVGQTVSNYKAGNYTWKILGAENGKLLLTTSTTVGPQYTLTGSADKWDDTNKKWTEFENELNEMFSDSQDSNYYINIGTNAESIRSINVEDIKKITGDALSPMGEPVTITAQEGQTLINGKNSCTAIPMDDTLYSFNLEKTEPAATMLIAGNSYFLASTFVLVSTGDWRFTTCFWFI